MKEMGFSQELNDMLRKGKIAMTCRNVCATIGTLIVLFYNAIPEQISIGIIVVLICFLVLVGIRYPLINRDVYQIIQSFQRGEYVRAYKKFEMLKVENVSWYVIQELDALLAPSKDKK
ncbi:MAG TPA: hypothetical protein DCY20_00715 [Firmicutes bacterium]|nr:hypothetical protein [Bacillota bacterium]